MFNMPTVFDDLVHHLADNAPPEQILAFKPSPADQARAEWLLERNSAGELTADERLELAQMLDVDRLISVLKAQAIARLKQR